MACRFSEKGVDRGIAAAHDISQIYHVEAFLCLGLLDRRQRCRNRKAIKAYIQNQLEEEKMSDQISIKEFIDPFMGSKNPKA